MNPSLEETITVDFVTSSPTTGAATDADSTPTCEVFEDATDTAILSPTVVKRSGKTGDYRVSVALTSANGFEASKSYNVVASATVGAVAAKAVIRTFQMRARDIDDVSTYAGTDTAGTTTLLTRLPAALTVTSGKVDVNDKTGFALTAPYDAAKTASTQASVDSKASQASVDAVSGYVDTEVAAIKVATDKLNTAMEIDGGVYRFTANALEQAPTGTGGGGSITPGDITAIAQEILKIDWTTVSGEAAYSVLNALRMLRNVWTTAGGTLSVKKEDGSTTAWTRTLSTDSAAEPIVGAS